MPSKTKPERPRKFAVSNFAPKSITVNIEGEDVRVALDKYENAILNCFLASRLRSTLEKHLDAYKKDERILTPKELRDLAETARNIAAFSAEVYQANEPISPSSEKPAEATKEEENQFDALTSIPKVNEPTGETPETDDSGPVSGLQGETPS